MDPNFETDLNEAILSIKPDAQLEPVKEKGLVEGVVGAHVDAAQGVASAASSTWDTISGWADEAVEGSGIKRLASEDFWGGEVDHSQDLLHELEQGGPSPMANTVEEAQVGEVNKELGDSTLARSIAGGITGVAEAGIQTFDAVKDDYTYTGPKSSFRQYVEAVDESNRQESAVASITGDLAQFTAGLIGAGKLLGPLKALSSGKTAALAWETTRGAMAGYFAMDPNDDRLADLVQSYPGLQNPVSEFLAHQPGDSDSVSRLKNALEGIGMDLAIAGAFATSMKAIRALRSGDQKVAAEALQEATQQEAAVDAVVEKQRFRVKAGSERVPQEKPRQRVKAGSEKVPLPGKAKDDVATPPSSTQAIDEVGTELPAEAVEVKPRKMKEMTQPKYKEITDSTLQDVRAMEMAGGYDAAVKAGWRMTTAQTHPWQLLNTGEEVRVYMQNTAAVLQKDWNKVKGGEILSDAKLRRQVMSMGEWFGDDPQGFVADLAQAAKTAKDLPAKLQAGYLTSTSMFMDAYKAMTDINFGKYALYGDTPEAATAEIKRRLTVAAKIYGDAQALRASVGRSMRGMRKEFAITPEDIARIESLDQKQLAAFFQTTGGDPSKIKSLARPGFAKRFWDEAMFIQRNGLLWGYPSHIVNLTGNTLMMGLRPAEKVIGGGLQALTGNGSGPLKQALKEIKYTALSMMDGMKDGAEAFMKGDSKLAPHQSGWVDTEGAMDTAALRPLGELSLRPIKEPADLYHNMAQSLNYLYRNASGLPTRFMAGQDEFYKVIRYRSVLQARAEVEGISQGLFGKDLKDYVASQLKQGFDESGQALDRAALLEAQTTTFNQELLSNTMGASIRNFRAQHPWVGIVLPFVKTPVNVLRYAHKYTPMLNLFQKEYRNMVMGKVGAEAQAQAMGQMALGGMFAFTGVYMASNGIITGGGPSDPKMAAQLRAMGWRPYSIKRENADGSITYLPYNRFDPMGMVLGIAGDLSEKLTMDPESRDIEGVGTAFAMSIAKNFGDRTFLMNLNNLFEALADPEDKMERFLGTSLGGLVPGSSAMRTYVNQDEYMRETRTVLDMALKDIPGYSSKLPPRRDAFGEPMVRRIGLTTTSKMDVVETEHSRIMLAFGEGIGNPSHKVGNVDLRDFTLKNGRNAYDLYQEYAAQPVEGGKTLKEVLETLITSDKYQLLVDGGVDVKGTKLNAIRGVVDKFRDAAMRRLKKENPDLLGAISEEKLKVGAKVFQNAGKPTTKFDKAMEALGISKE